jgi:hypothetical protein
MKVQCNHKPRCDSRPHLAAHSAGPVFSAEEVAVAVVEAAVEAAAAAKVLLLAEEEMLTLEEVTLAAMYCRTAIPGPRNAVAPAPTPPNNSGRLNASLIAIPLPEAAAVCIATGVPPKRRLDDPDTPDT